MVDAEPIR